MDASATSEDNAPEVPSTGQQATDIFIFSIVILASVVLIALFTYGFSLFLDRYWSRGAITLSEEEWEERQHASVVLLKAKLGGLLPQERFEILSHFLKARAYPYQIEDGEKENNENRESSNESNAEAEIEAPPVAVDDGDIEADKALDENSEIDIEQGEVPSGTCPICLAEYEENDIIVTGSHCPHHEVHLSCLLEWMDNRKEQRREELCVYCRKPLLTAEEYRASATEVVGIKRVTKLTKVNEFMEDALAASQEQAAGSSAVDSPTSNSEVDVPEANTIDREVDVPATPEIELVASRADAEATPSTEDEPALDEGTIEKKESDDEQPITLSSADIEVDAAPGESVHTEPPSTSIHVAEDKVDGCLGDDPDTCIKKDDEIPAEEAPGSDQKEADVVLVGQGTEDQEKMMDDSSSAQEINPDAKETT